MRRPEYKHIIEKLSVDYFEKKTLLLKDKQEIITKFETEAIYYEKLSLAGKYLIAREYYQKFMFFSDSNLIKKLNQFIGVPVFNINNIIDFSLFEK